MIKKIFVLALILIAINYFYGAKVASWWQSWRSGAKVNDYAQQLTNKAADEFQDQTTKYSEQLIKMTATSLTEEGKKKIDEWLNTNKLNEYGDPQDKTHAWFTVFAPWDDPEIVVTVLLEGAGEGSYEAAPVAKEILASWFSSK